MIRTRRSPLPLVALLAALLLCPPGALAKPAWHDKAPRSKTTQGQLRSASRTYNRARQSNARSKSLVRKQMKLYKRTGNAQQKAYAQKNAVKAGRAKVRMVRAQVKGLKAKAKLAIKAGHPDKANKYLDKAAKLEQQASKLSANLDKAEARFGGAAPVGGTASKRTGAVADGSDASGGSSGSSQQAADGENPLSQPQKTQSSSTSKVAGVASGKGKRQAKMQLKSGNVLGALDTLKAMEAQPSRGGVAGMVDGYRKWSTRRAILKKAQKGGVRAARTGDLQLAAESAEAITTLRKPGYFTNRKVNAIGNAALKGAKKMARTHRPEEARMMLDFARQIQASMGRAKPTLRYRMVRRTANKRVWSDLKSRAKSGNMEAFRSAMRLANAYAQEGGKGLSKGQVKTIRKLYMTAMKNSVPRALKDAQMLLSGKMGYVNVEEAANRFAYAYDTAGKLARRGVNIRVGVFGGGLEKQFNKTRELLVTAMQDQATMREIKRPGVFKRAYEKIFKQPQQRTQQSVAPLDSRWIQQQQRAQQAEMGDMAGAM